MNQFKPPPTRKAIIEMVATHMYSARIINNSHRGDIVEMMVLSTLGDEWRFVGLGWHPWDFQRGKQKERVRIQVKQCAALQIWGKTQKPTLKFGWKKNASDEFKRNNPEEEIESEGWFCDIFVFGLHLEKDPEKADQVDLAQWEFLVIPTCDLNKGRKSMLLTEALKKWKRVPWAEISTSLELAIEKNNKQLG